MSDDNPENATNEPPHPQQAWPAPERQEPDTGRLISFGCVFVVALVFLAIAIALSRGH
jgi:hypothetical protein